MHLANSHVYTDEQHTHTCMHVSANDMKTKNISQCIDLQTRTYVVAGTWKIHGSVSRMAWQRLVKSDLLTMMSYRMINHGKLTMVRHDE